MKRTTCVFGFDMETDVGSWTSGYKGLTEGTPLLLDLLARQGVKATFFFTGDSAKRHPGTVKNVCDARHEVGAHSLYHETVGDSLFDIPGVYPILDHELKPRLELNCRYIKEACGVQPVSFRSPRLFGGTNVVNTLEELGFVADASYPLYYYQERLVPYRPSREDWTQEGDSRVVELPNFADVTIQSKDKYRRDQDQWPLFRTEGAETVMRHVGNYLGFLDSKGLNRFLCFYFHPWEFIEMPQGDIQTGEGIVRPDPFIVKNCGDYALQQLDLMITALKKLGGEFFTAKEAAAHHTDCS